VVKNKLKNNMSLSWKWIQDFFWRRQALYGLLLTLLLVLVVFQLSKIPIFYAEAEVLYAKSAQTLSSISENPLSLPHKIASFIGLQFSDSVQSVRGVSIVFFGLCVVALYRILKRWHSDKIALFASAMFATNATVLAVGRLGTSLVLLFCWSIVISLLLWLQHGSSRKVAPFTLIVISAGLLYVPGAPYFFLLMLLLFGKKLRRTIKSIKRSVVYTAIFVGILVIIPLFISFAQNPELFKQWLLLPPTIDWGTIPRNILRVPSAFIYRTPVYPLLNIGRLPVFDVASGGLFLIGLYAYQKHAKLERTRIMLATALLSVVIGALGELAIAIVLLLPFVYSVIGAGISYLLDEWYSIFPKNPFARSFGLLLITFIVSVSIYYQLTRFLVVWPQTPETRAVYNQSGLIQ
jgi:4-amino-4-deoxy-L-arabinose transferase-like glycosyltransferase